jgi:hypothetical protein
MFRLPLLSGDQWSLNDEIFSIGAVSPVGSNGNERFELLIL